MTPLKNIVDGCGADQVLDALVILSYPLTLLPALLMVLVYDMTHPDRPMRPRRPLVLVLETAGPS